MSSHTPGWLGGHLGHSPKWLFVYKLTSYVQLPVLKGHFSCVARVAAHSRFYFKQISWFSNSSKIIHQRVFRKKIVKIRWILTNGERLLRAWIYVNKLVAAILAIQISWFSNLSRIIHQSVLKKNHNDLMNIEDWRAVTSILDMQISPWLPSWICNYSVCMSVCLSEDDNLWLLTITQSSISRGSIPLGLNRHPSLSIIPIHLDPARCRYLIECKPTLPKPWKQMNTTLWKNALLKSAKFEIVQN